MAKLIDIANIPVNAVRALIRRTSQGLFAPTAAPPRAAGRLALPALEADSMGQTAAALLKGLTPDKVVAIFDNAAMFLEDQVQLAHDLEERNDHVRGTLEVRRSSVLGLKASIKAGDDDEPRSAAAAELAEEFLTAPWFYQMREHLLRAIFLQWAAVEVFYDDDWMPCGVRPVEPRRFHFDANQQLVLYRTLNANPQDVVTPIAGRFAVFGYGVTSTPGELALVRSVALLILMATLDIKNWATQIDMFGLPFMKVFYEAGLAKEKVRAIITDLLTLGGRRIGAVPQGTSLETEKIPDQLPHKDFQEHFIRRVSRLLLGQDSSQTAIEGQKTGATLQGEVRDDIRDRDALLLSAAINETFLAPWCAWKFGPDVKPPRIELVENEEVEPSDRAAVFIQAQQIGLPLVTEQVYRELRLERPEGMPDILTPPAPQAPPMFGGPGGVPSPAPLGNSDSTPPTRTDAIAKVGDASGDKTPGDQPTARNDEPYRASRIGFRPGAFCGVDDGGELRAFDNRDETPVARSYFEQHLKVAQSLIESVDAEGGSDAEKAQRFRTELPHLLDAIYTQPLADEVHARTFGAFCAGRLKTGELLQRRMVLANDATPPVTHAQFKEAIDQFAQRNDLVSKPKFLKLQGQDRARAWTVARVTDLDVMKDLHDAVGNVIEGGQSWRDFQSSLGEVMKKRGWEGLEPWHAKVVYDQNVAMAYSAGRTTQARDAGLTHWRKLPSEAAQPRDEHAAYDNQIFTFDQKSPPPWDFGCQCGWEPVFEDELEPDQMSQLGGPSDELPGAEEFRWDASHYFRAPELRKGDYPQEFWSVIDQLGALFNRLLTPA